jgi:hypothetical protein
MVDVKKLYDPDNGWGLWSDYQPMVDAFGKVVIQVDDDDYQGDTRVLYHNDDGRIGHLIFGWGSCSYCDALMGCSTIEAVQELCDELEADIEWFDNKAEALEWFKTHDWEGNYYWYDGNTRKYVEKAIEYLSK